MKAIIKNGVANKDIQSCLISECGVEITFHNNDLADKFALSLNLSGIPCVNKVTTWKDKYNKLPYHSRK